MNKIKFSHKYSKLKCMAGIGNIIYIINSAELLQVFKCHYKDLSKNFIEFDTKYKIWNDTFYYKLPKNELIILIFKDFIRGYLFTTIRRYTPKKYEYYKSKMGEIFEVTIEEIDKEEK